MVHLKELMHKKIERTNDNISSARKLSVAESFLFTEGAFLILPKLLEMIEFMDTFVKEGDCECNECYMCAARNKLMSLREWAER